MKPEQITMKNKLFFFFFLGVGFFVAGRVFLSGSFTSAQAIQSPRLEWVESQRKNPVTVSSHEALFQIKLIDPQEHDPNRLEVTVWIDTDNDKQIDEGETMALEPYSNEPLSVGRVYSTTLHFLPQRHIESGIDPEGNECEQLKSFETNFCFSLAIDGIQYDPNYAISGGPIDPNNRLIVFNKNCDSDKDGVDDLEEGVDPLLGYYWHDPNYAYKNDTLVSLATPGGKIAMKINHGSFRQVRLETESDPNRPEEDLSNLYFPYGFVSFRIIDMRDKTVDLKTLFPVRITDYAEFCRYSCKKWLSRIGYSQFNDDYDEGNTWRYESFPTVPEMQRRSLMLKLEDNNPRFDSNEEDYEINDPVGLGVPKPSGEGRCFLSYIAF